MYVRVGPETAFDATFRDQNEFKKASCMRITCEMNLNRNLNVSNGISVAY